MTSLSMLCTFSITDFPVEMLFENINIYLKFFYNEEKMLKIQKS